ncbi:hypothetical protein NQ176_g5226 [Zarea fungicola]|uniref:Uncharacterized protein n=1 Tax=Zarea fungicola TaxID=93591 RepID=A0ACC1NAL9_9HYPO|nr:hypothetical protein NQ176_g5226 [Lecanicillium fungicola]
MTLKTLPERYEIRKLGPEHQEWVNAILIHSNMFHSPIWPIVYPDGLTARSMAAYKAAEYLVKHQLESGYSYGIFDKEHKYRTPEAEAAGGLLHWDTDDTTSDGAALLEQMDFPLV